MYIYVCMCLRGGRATSETKSVRAEERTGSDLTRLTA